MFDGGTRSSRTLPRDLVAERERPAYRRCPYCGAPCSGATCPSHRDLLAKDPAHDVALHAETVGRITETS